jgi:NAD(P)H-hydrate repair Nnr-like enzyme with NAD(P)H-hydrate dehydratase domain
VKLRRARAPRPIEVDRKLLIKWRLPMPGSDGDKEDRGRLLIVAGSSDVPGAAVLSANAALRAGVGKLTVATEETVVVAQSVPEARVLPFHSGPRGEAGIRVSHSRWLRRDTRRTRPAVVGRGREMRQERDEANPAAMVVLDAGALTADVAAALPAPRNQGAVRCILTPHAGEMASLLGITKRAVEAAPEATALGFASRHDVAIVLKGAVRGSRRVAAVAPRGEQSGAGDVRVRRRARRHHRGIGGPRRDGGAGGRLGSRLARDGGRETRSPAWHSRHSGPRNSARDPAIMNALSRRPAA